MPFPIRSDVIPLPVHLAMTFPERDELISLAFSSETYTINLWAAEGMYTPVLMFLLSGKPSSFVPRCYEAIKQGFDRDFSEMMNAPPNTPVPEGMRNLAYLLGLAGTKKRVAKRRLRQFSSRSWTPFMSTVSVGRFYTEVRDTIVGNDGFVSGLALPQNHVNQLISNADRFFEGDMRRVIGHNNALIAEHGSADSVPEEDRKFVIFEALRAKERWILTVAGIPDAYQEHFMIELDFPLFDLVDAGPEFA